MVPEQSRAERNKQIVQTMYGYANSGDYEAMLDIWADDITLLEADSHPFPGFWQGKEAVQKAAAGVIGEKGLNMIKTEPVEWMAGDDRVGVLIKISCRDKNGEEFSVDCMELWKINEDGKIAGIWPFYHDMYYLRERLGLD